MRKLNKIFMVVVMLAVTIPTFGAMSTSKVRKNTRFLTDRMAYELNLSQNQYDDVYEVNYDFVNNVRYIMNDVARGDYYAIDRYYNFLDVRNDDLRWILSPSQYARFLTTEYFYRPIYTRNSRWDFRIYTVYSNINFFYFGKPYHYSTYRGGHYRTHHNNVSFYKSRWNTRYNFRDRYHNHINIRNDRRFDNYRNHDFGVGVKSNRRSEVSRPNNNGRPNSTFGPNNNRNSNNIRIESNNRNNTRTNNVSRPSRVENRRENSERMYIKNNNEKIEKNSRERSSSNRSSTVRESRSSSNNNNNKNSSSNSRERSEGARRR